MTSYGTFVVVIWNFACFVLSPPVGPSRNAAQAGSAKGLRSPRRPRVTSRHDGRVLQRLFPPVLRADTMIKTQIGGRQRIVYHVLLHMNTDRSRPPRPVCHTRAMRYPLSRHRQRPVPRNTRSQPPASCATLCQERHQCRYHTDAHFHPAYNKALRATACMSPSALPRVFAPGAPAMLLPSHTFPGTRPPPTRAFPATIFSAAGRVASTMMRR